MAAKDCLRISIPRIDGVAMHGLVYVVMNHINGKVYVGQTTQRLSNRWAQHKHSVVRGSKTPFHLALKKYGLDNFSVCEVTSANDQAGLDAQEDAWMDKLQSRNKSKGYNRDATGRVVRDPEVGSKISHANKGRTAWNKGKRLSEEQRRRMSEGMKGRVAWNKGLRMLRDDSGRFLGKVYRG